MLRLHISLFALLISFSLFAQEEGPTATPATDAFSAGADQVGLLQNSVNLFSGEVAFSLPLVTLPGRGGLDAGIALTYQSAGVRQQATTWNLDAPTSVVGLGWQLNLPRIIVDHKQTGTRTDDQFYIVDGTSSTRLILVAKEAKPSPNEDEYLWTFKTNQDPFRTISFDEVNEIWTVQAGDGTRYIYGDKNSSRNTVQYLIRWGNWIGSSSVTTGQAQQAMQWNLSAIRNRFDDEVTFTYEQVKRKVGGELGLEHTEASYLSKIENPQGQSITLAYEDKQMVEYQDPHTEQVEPDAYQERYETKALDYVSIADQDDNERYRLDLTYEIQVVGEFTKRTLTSIQKVDTDNTPLYPPLRFQYYQSGKNSGTLQAATTSQGPQVLYNYSKVAIEQSDRTFSIDAPAGYAEAQTWIGPDYVVVAWRALDGGNHSSSSQTVRVSMYQWEGRWIEQFRQTLSAELLNKQYKDFQVTLQRDFFAIQNSNAVFLSHKDPARPGIWQVDNKFFTRDAKDPVLLSGDRFVAVVNKVDGKMKTFVWNGDDWEEELIEHPTGVGDYFIGGGPNYIICNDNDQGESNNDKIFFYYLDELRHWQLKTLP
ncbi:MAG: hypothetical protein AAF223_10165, partial [Bacteroidota bacterium]